MYIHLGRDYVLNDRDIIGIFDLETTTISPRGREFLNYAQKNGAVVSLSDELPSAMCWQTEGWWMRCIFRSCPAPPCAAERKRWWSEICGKRAEDPQKKEGWESPGTARKAAPCRPERPLRAARENTTKRREKSTPWCTGSRFAII